MLLALLLGIPAALRAQADSGLGPSILEDIVWANRGDTIQVEMRFGGNLPEKYKGGYFKDSLGNLSLLIAFKGATLDDAMTEKKLPRWLLAQDLVEADDDQTRVHIFLKEEVPFRTNWQGSTLVLQFPNRTNRDNSIWKSPWLYAGLGAATALGGAMVWMSAGGSAPTPSGPGDIPPPDIELPR